MEKVTAYKSINGDLFEHSSSAMLKDIVKVFVDKRYNYNLSRFNVENVIIGITQSEDLTEMLIEYIKLRKENGFLID